MVVLLAGVFYYAVVIAQQYVASVMVSALFFYRCMIEMGHFQRHWQWVSYFAGGLELVWTSAEEMRQHRERDGGEAAPAFHEAIEFRDVSYAYGEQSVLQGINIRIRKNTAVAFVGASGVGKTTLVDLLTGVLKPTRGTICIDDRDLHALDLSRSDTWSRTRFSSMIPLPIISAWNGTSPAIVRFFLGFNRPPATVTVMNLSKGYRKATTLASASEA